MDYNTQEITFRLHDDTIDYFKIPTEDLKEDGYSVDHKQLTLKAGEFLRIQDVLPTSNDSKTTVLNIQAGKGKSTILYELAEHYVQQGIIVIIASPYKKLVDKDFDHLNERKLRISHYEKFPEVHEKDVHVMTINCLLRNPGEDSFQQKLDKGSYLDELLHYIKSNKKKCIIIFDEIHAGLVNFQNRYVANIYAWAGIVEHCYISSATFTVATYPLIKMISELTGKRITIIEGPRFPNKEKAELHIYISDSFYSGENIEPLFFLQNILSDHKGETVNIITGTKSLANSIIELREKEKEFGELFSTFDFNITLGDDASSHFSNNCSNIGTTFSTGINITGTKSVLIIILPCIVKHPSYGIFSDGTTSIIQTLARVRNQGKIYVIMQKPQVSLGNSGELMQAFSSHPPIGYNNLNYNLTSIKDNYSRINMHRKSEINALNKDNTGLFNETLDQYLLASTNLLLKNQYSYGKELSPYVLWAALNNQFTNAKLCSIRLIKPVVDYVKISEKAPIGTIQKKFGNEIFNVLNNNLHDATNNLIKSLKDNFSGNIIFKGLSVKSSEIARYPTLLRLFMEAIVEVHIGTSFTLTDEDYILGHTLQVQLNSINDYDNSSGSRMSCYIQLSNARDEFIEFVSKHTYHKNNELLVPANLYESISEMQFNKWKQAIANLNSQDYLLSKTAIRFVPKAKVLSYCNESKKAIYKALALCFTNISSTRKAGSKGEKEHGRLVKGNIHKTLSTNLSVIPFF